MTPLFNKLNLGSHRNILILNAPASFESELAALAGVTVSRNPAELPTMPFTLAFVRTLAEVEAVAASLPPMTLGDVVIWFAYPKASSKRYQCEFNRDTGWAAARAAGFDTVRQIAIDGDWSALRFRRSVYIKSSTGAESRVSSPAMRRAQKRDKKP
jgi:hypothetical protein